MTLSQRITKISTILTLYSKMISTIEYQWFETSSRSLEIKTLIAQREIARMKTILPKENLYQILKY